MKTSIALLSIIGILCLSSNIQAQVKQKTTSEKTEHQKTNELFPLTATSTLTSDSSDLINASKAGFTISNALSFDEAKLGSNHLLFASPTSSDSSYVTKGGIGLTSSFFYKSNSEYKASSLEFTNPLGYTIIGAGGLRMDGYDFDTTSTIIYPHYLRQENKDCVSYFSPEEIALYTSSPVIESSLTKDTMRFYKEKVGLLFDEVSNFSSLAADFEFGPNLASYGAFGMTNDDGIFNLSVSPRGFILKEALSSVDIFNRLTIEPDSFVMYNAAKYKTIRLGTDPQSLGGSLTLFDTQTNIHTSIIDDQNGDVTMEMNHQGDLRVWLGTFQEGGIINTVGQNGSMNTYLGRADRHLDGRFGGLGVMDDVSILRAGMEVDESRKGLVYTNGSIKVFDDLNFEWTEINRNGYYLYNSTNNKSAHLGANQQSGGGALTLFDTLTNIHTSIEDDQNGDVTMQMNHKGDLRVWLGTFEEGGIINTVGQNGSMNTYLGRADRHVDGRFGGLGVMDDVSILRAGMEVDESRKGLVYTNGSIKVFDDVNFEWSEMNRYGYYLNNSSGGFTATMTSDVLDVNVGYMSAFGANQAPNFFAGANWNYNGNGNSGIASVLDQNGNDQAAILVNQNDEGIVFSDFAFFGSEPINNPVYSLQVQQQPNYGVGLFRNDTSFYEFYITNLNDLGLYKNNTTIGFFDDATGAYNQVSDQRMKVNIRSMDSALERVNKLNPSRYSYKRNKQENSETIGFVAQEVQELFPELVSRTTDKENRELLAINYSGMSVVAIKAIQEQQKIIDQQDRRINKLELEIAEIKALLNKK